MNISKTDILEMVHKCVEKILLEENLITNKIEEYSIYDLFQEFFWDKKNGIKSIQFQLIPAEQYKNLVSRYAFAQTPEMARIPSNLMDRWIDLIVCNFIKLVYITELAGHTRTFPGDDLADIFNDDYNIDWYDYQEASEYLDNIGFYDWCKLPDGSDAWSDYGLEPIWKILSEYNLNMDGEEKLILINRVLNVAHCRGDLASAFIEGGKSTCSIISGQYHDKASCVPYNL